MFANIPNNYYMFQRELNKYPNWQDDVETCIRLVFFLFKDQLLRKCDREEFDFCFERLRSYIEDHLYCRQRIPRKYKVWRLLERKKQLHYVSFWYKSLVYTYQDDKDVLSYVKQLRPLLMWW